MATREYRVGDMNRLIRESANEFKAKLGDGVAETNKKQNSQAYADAKKRAQDYDGGLKDGKEKRAAYKKEDANGTLLDYNVNGADDKYRARVKAQALGYTSELEQKNNIEKQGDYSGNEQIFNGIKDSGKETHKAKKAMAKSGLQAREWPDNAFGETQNELYENKIRTLKFKRTKFIDESDMRDRIPEEFRKEGQKFRMTDCVNNTFLCEWTEGDAQILEHTDRNGLNESLTRMKQLMGYNPGDKYSRSTPKERLNEDKNTMDLLGRMRQLM